MGNLIALDLSLTETGYCLFDEKEQLINSGIITTKLIGEERIDYIKTTIHTLIIDYTPENAIIEGYSFGSSGRATFSIGELGGVIRNLLFELKIPFINVPPTSLKKMITGKGNCPKNLMLLKVYKNYGMEFYNDNICDAFALGKYFFDLKNKNCDTK